MYVTSHDSHHPKHTYLLSASSPFLFPLFHNIEFVVFYSWTISFFDSKMQTVILVFMYMLTKAISNKAMIDVLIYFLSLTIAYHVSQNKCRMNWLSIPLSLYCQ